MNRYLTDTLPMLDRYLTGRHVDRCIGGLSVVRPLSIGDLSVDSRPIVGPQSTDISVEATYSTFDPT